MSGGGQARLTSLVGLPPGQPLGVEPCSAIGNGGKGRS